MTIARASRGAGPLLMVIAAFLAGGCAAPRVEFGTPPPTQALGDLTPMVSTTEDVVRVLGKPQGRGAIEHAPRERPRKLWLYFFAAGVDTTIEGKYLFVFLDGDRYEGHLWFTSRVDSVEE